MAQRTHLVRSRLPGRLALGLTLLAAVGSAQPVVTPGVPACVPAGGNSLVELTVQPEAGWTSVRTYFRKSGSTDLYYLEMKSSGGGRFWAVLPLPRADTAAVDLQLVLVDGQGLQTRSAMTTVQVTGGCAVALTAEQRTFADNLVVGETVPAQEGRDVLGFQCPGVISRINFEDEIRADETCRKMLMARDDRKLLVPLVVLGGVGGGVAIVESRDDKDASPHRP